MNRHTLHYVDMHPRALETRKPSTLPLVVGAALALVALWCATVFLFSL